jgi:hypothetical protein
MEENAKCYTYEELHFDDELLPTVDATYIIHLEGNGRYKSIQNQLEEYHPTKLLYILHNKGYKTCEKVNVNNPSKDLVDSFLQIFKHAKERNYENILILEDDFIFCDKIKDSFHNTNVNNFVLQNQNKNCVYLLGQAPILLIPYDYYNYQILLSGGTHCVIYNRKCIESILSISEENIIDWDRFLVLNFYKYTYYLPLCYQLIPETENSKNWGNGGIVDYILVNHVVKSIYKLLLLDTQVEPGYSILYFTSKLLFYLILFLLVLVLYKLMPLQLPRKLIKLTNKLKVSQQN